MEYRRADRPWMPCPTRSFGASVDGRFPYTGMSTPLARIIAWTGRISLERGLLGDAERVQPRDPDQDRQRGRLIIDWPASDGLIRQANEIAGWPSPGDGHRE